MSTVGGVRVCAIESAVWHLNRFKDVSRLVLSLVDCN
jgi:hypothetical protein